MLTKTILRLTSHHAFSRLAAALARDCVHMGDKSQVQVMDKLND